MFDRRGNRLFDIPHPELPEQVAFSADGRFVAVIGQTQLQICDASSGMEVDSYRLPAKEGGLTVAFSHNGQHLACGDRYWCDFPPRPQQQFNLADNEVRKHPECSGLQSRRFAYRHGARRWCYSVMGCEKRTIEVETCRPRAKRK